MGSGARCTSPVPCPATAGAEPNGRRCGSSIWRPPTIEADRSAAGHYQRPEALVACRRSVDARDTDPPDLREQHVLVVLGTGLPAREHLIQGLGSGAQVLRGPGFGEACR